MPDESLPESPTHALIPWQTIFQHSNQVVLYNPTSHALAIRNSSKFPKNELSSLCPYCQRPIPGPNRDDDTGNEQSHSGIQSRAPNYFQLLAIAKETSTRLRTPPAIGAADSEPPRTGSSFSVDMMAEGYFEAFFRPECRLGMGANGSVYLCQHVLDGNPLGRFAVKKIAVGESHSYLLKILREVRLLERLHHPNIITYHHAWLEACQFSIFGPKVPTLHVLMQWAEGGSLDDFIDARQGRATARFPVDHLNDSRLFDESSNGQGNRPPFPLSQDPVDPHSRSARIRAYRALHRAPPEEREKIRRVINADPTLSSSAPGIKSWTAVHLLSAEEVCSLFGDIVNGLSFLHDKSILHLDLKPGNVLLTWDEGKLVPRAMLADFGTSQDMIHSSRNRTGNTGTLEYASPESLPSPDTGLLQQVDSKADMWSLGMILHKLLFFRLPYRYAADGDALEDGKPGVNIEETEKMQNLEREVLDYPGFRSTQALVTAFAARRLPRAYLVLLESLLNVSSSNRPSCERVLSAIREGKLDPLPLAEKSSASTNVSLVPVVRRRSDAGSSEINANEVQGGIEDESKLSAQEDDSLGLPAQPADEKEEISAVEERPEKGMLLGLPAPYDQRNLLHRRLDRLGFRTPRTLWVRSVKSTILVIKAFSIASLCPDSHSWAILSFGLLSVAIVDTWSDEMWISALLAAVHVVIVRFGCSKNRCCL